MAEDDFQPWKGVEYAADNQTDGMDGGLSSEAPRHRQKRKIAATVVGVVGVGDGMVRDSRMQIDRNVERLCPFENAPKSFIVEEGSGGQAVNQRTLKIVLCNGAFEFIGRGLGSTVGNSAKPANRDGCARVAA